LNLKPDKILITTQNIMELKYDLDAPINKDNNPNILTAGPIAGIVIACIVFLIIIIFLI